MLDHCETACTRHEAQTAATNLLDGMNEMQRRTNKVIA